MFFKTQLQKDVESLVKLTQCLDNEVRGLRSQYHNLYESFDAFTRELGYEISIKPAEPRKVTVVKKSVKEKASKI